MIESLKFKIEHNEKIIMPLIFIRARAEFLTTQYIDALSALYDDILILDNLQNIYASNNAFGETHGCLKLFYIDKLDNLDERFKTLNDVIIVADNVTDNVLKDFASNIVIFPAIEDWQIKDYVYSRCDGVNTEKLDWLIQLCNSNLFRLKYEADKIQIFPVTQRKYLFDDFLRDGVFDDLSQYTIFNITDAIQKRDAAELGKILEELSRIDVEQVGVVTVLHNNFEKLIKVWLTNNPTEENTGIKSNQIWAIKKLPKVWSKEQLIKMFKIICEIDDMYKSGKLPVKNILDYVLIKAFSL